MTKTAIIGTGGWGKNHVRSMTKLKSCELVACCDINEKNLQAAKAINPAIQTTGKAEEIFSNPEIEAVSIVTTSPTHYALGKAALDAGKHVLIEKPLTLTAADAADLVKTAEKKNKVLMVGHLLIYHPGVAKMKDIIDTGELGDIYYLYAQRVNLGKVRSNENALWSFAPHDISVVLHLFNGVPDRVTANGVCYLQEGIQDVVFATLYFPDNKMAHIHLSWLDPHKERKITLVGSKKMAVFDDMSANEKIRIYDKGANVHGEILSYQEAITLRNGDIYIPRIDMKEPLSIEVGHFIDCVQNSRKPVTDGENGLAVVKVLEAAQRSLDMGGHPVKLEKAL